MGSFTLIHKKTQPDIEKFETINKEKGLIISFSGAVGEYNLFYFNKPLIEENCFLVRDGAAVFTSGTLIYKNTSNITDSLNLLLEDLVNNRFSYKNIRGHYSFIYTPDFKSIHFGIDQIGVQNVFYDEQYQFISTSFLSLVSAFPGTLTYNTNAIVENIVHGFITGPDTIFNEIKRFEVPIVKNLGAISLVQSDFYKRDFTSTNSYDGAINEQLNNIRDFFADTSAFLNNYGVELGLSDGHDSRLLSGFTKKHLSKIHYYTFWRKKKNREMEIAEGVAKALNTELIVREGKHPLDKNENELGITYNSAFLFYDGLPKLHSYFSEDQNTIYYKNSVEYKVGLNGIGGEQYRNGEHVFWGSAKHKFVKDMLTYYYAGRCFKDNYDDIFFNKIKYKIDSLLPINNKNEYTKKDLRIYYNEVYVNGLRTNRTNAENHFSFFLSPFIDAALVIKSYSDYNHLGLSYDFQQEMIRRTDMELAKVPSGYGYSFSKREPIKDKIKYLIKSFIPASLIIQRIEKHHTDKTYRKYIDKYSFLNEAYNEILALDLPLKMEMIMGNKDKWPVVFSLGYTLCKLKKLAKIEISTTK